MGGERTGRGPLVTAGLTVFVMVTMLPGPVGLAEPARPSSGAVNLSVDVVTHLRPVPPGTVVAYEAVVRNRGTLVAQRTAAVFEIPASSISVEGTSASCAVVGSMHIEAAASTEVQPWRVKCNLGAVAPGANIRLAFAVTSGSPGTHIAVARVSSIGDDAEPIDNTTETPLLVLPDAPEFTRAFQQPGPFNPSGRTRA